MISQMPGLKKTHCDSNVGDGDKGFSGGFEVSVQVEGDNMQENISMKNQSDASVKVLTSPCVNQAATERLASSPSRNMGGSLSSVTNVETGLSEFHDISRSKVNATICETVSDAGISRGSEHQTLGGQASNDGRKQMAPTRTRSKGDAISRRRSLKGAGTIWENGRRKSSRCRFRPLEHWRGERLLYGRIHESLSTVIGVKYASLGKETFKVESYVSDEYADLVAKVARC